MRFHTTPAIVLSSINYGESDAIVNFYTQDYGRLGGIAKGARRSRRRFGGTLETFSYGRLIFVKKGELVRVDQWDIVEGFHGIKQDLERIACGSYMLELVRELVKEGQKNQEVFILLLNSLSTLEGGNPLCPPFRKGGEGGFVMEGDIRPDILTKAFEMRFLTAIGYQPCLDRCVVCKQIPIGGNTLFFSSAKGGVLCPRCANPVRKLDPLQFATGQGRGLLSSGAKVGGGLIPITPETAKTLILMVRLGLERIAHLSISSLMLREGERVLEDFIRYLLGKELRSKRFLKCISRM